MNSFHILTDLVLIRRDELIAEASRARLVRSCSTHAPRKRRRRSSDDWARQAPPAPRLDCAVDGDVRVRPAELDVTAGTRLTTRAVSVK